jgi:hypothetical protein
MNCVTLENKLAELESLHRQLDEKIAKGHTNYLDDEDLSKMKQHKLTITREIKSIKVRLNNLVFDILR